MRILRIQLPRRTEGLGVDDDGNIYGAYQSQGMVHKFIKN
jgi:hypothetical protein